MEQGSKSWLEWRNKGIGSSDIATILGVNPYNSVEDLWLEKTGQKPPPDLSNNFAVKRGTALEPIARNLINDRLSMHYDPATFEHPEYKFMRYSSDGYERDANEIIEIKCMGPKNHNKVLTEKRVIDYYMPQCMWGLMITGAYLCVFVSYNPEFENNLAMVEVHPDESYFKMIKEKSIWFWECVEQMKNPTRY